MIAPITSKVIRHIPYAGPIIQGVGLVFDVKDIVENSSPIGAAKVISNRFVKECTPPEIYLAGKCIMFVGGLIASVSTAANPLILSGTVSAARSIVKDL